MEFGQSLFYSGAVWFDAHRNPLFLVFCENLRRIRESSDIHCGSMWASTPLKYVSIPAKKCLAQRKNSSLPVTLGVGRIHPREFGAKRYSRPQRLFFAYFFLACQKKVCRRRHSLCRAKERAGMPPYGCIPLIKAKPEGIRLRASFLIAAAAHTSRRRYPRSGRPLRPSARRNRKTLLPSRFRCCCARSEAPPL